MRSGANPQPAPGGSKSSPPSGGGVKSVLKIAVPLLALMGVIFGITLFSMYTPKPPDSTEKGPGSNSGPGGEPPLRFFSSIRAWDPPSLDPQYRYLPNLAPSRDPAKVEDPYRFNLQDRVFQGFYEPSPEPPRRAAFWFENRNLRPVVMQLKGVSCGACSGARLAAVPPEVTKAYLQRTALASLPIGVFNAFGVGLVGSGAEFDRLEWDTKKFSEHPNATYKVPAASGSADKWAPQWGILELTFTVAENPRVPLTADFATQVEGTEQIGAHKFAIFFAPSGACAVSRNTIDVGEINQLTGEREYRLLLYSATRGPGSEFNDLTRPGWDVKAPLGANPGPFVEVSKIERVPEGDLFEVAQETAKAGTFTKVRAAYQITITLRPQVGDARLDIGALDRTVFLTTGSTTASVKLTAMVRGAVGLATGKSEIEIPTFKGRIGAVHTPELVSETTGLDLAVVPDECKPRFFKYELTKKPDRGGRGYYDLKITVPPARQYGAIDRSAVVVLENRPPKHTAVEAALGVLSQVMGAPVMFPPGQRIRIPVRGFGEQG